VTNHGIYWFLEFGEKGVEGKVIVSKIGFDDFKIHHALDDDSGLVPGATEFKVALDHTLQLLLQLNEVYTGRQDYSGRPTSLIRNRRFFSLFLHTGMVRFHSCPKEGEEVSDGDHLGYKGYGRHCFFRGCGLLV
jgi:hypothetical protein